MADRNQHVTITLKSGVPVEFFCDELNVAKNGLGVTVSFNWTNADRYVWVDFAEVAAVAVETVAVGAERLPL